MKVTKRLNELHEYLITGLRYRDFMEKKFQKYPSLREFKLEEVPDLIAKGIEMSKSIAIDTSEITAFQYEPDGFSFKVPSLDILTFHIRYRTKDELSIHASYKGKEPYTYRGKTFNVDTFVEVIALYVCNTCKKIKKDKKIS